MSTPADMDAVNWKLTMRKKFVDMIISLSPMTDPTLSWCCFVDKIPSCDFTKLFERLLLDNGVPAESVHSDLYDKIIFDENDSVKFDDDDDVCFFIRQTGYWSNPSLYMSFLSFIFNRNKVLAKKIFQSTEFNFASCIRSDLVTHDDFETILAYDVALGSDIFRNKRYDNLHNICSGGIISVAQINKLKKLVSVYGPDIMLWTSNNSVGSSYTNVNLYLRFGYIMDINSGQKMDETLDFLINSCPLALKQSVDIRSEKVNAYTIVLERCDSAADARHQMILHNVFQYFYLADLYTIYNGKGQTFQDLVGESGNTLVLGYLEKKFDIRIPNTSG